MKGDGQRHAAKQSSVTISNKLGRDMRLWVDFQPRCGGID